MDWVGIKSFLEKTVRILDSDILYKKKVLDAIKKETHIDLPKSSLVIKEGVVFVKDHPLIRTEIIMKKEAVLLELRNSFPELHIKNIK